MGFRSRLWMFPSSLTNRVGQWRGWWNRLRWDVEWRLSSQEDQTVGTGRAIVGVGHDAVCSCVKIPIAVVLVDDDDM